MINKRTIITFIITICFSFTLISSAFAATTVTVADKANTLNKLLIINDQMTEDKLNAPVKRWEAVVYLVRSIGMESKILGNKGIYEVSNYSDIKSTDWYSPYIGYCTQNEIVAGVQAEKFAPYDNISEKTFLSVAIRCLGYKNGVDFTWSDVYKKAYDLGLVKDSSYLTRIQDNTSFKKKDAVNILYNLLKSKMKDKNVSVIQNLILSGAVEERTVLEVGALMDTTETAIVTVTPTSNTFIQIIFNETMGKVSGTDIEIYDKQNSSNRITATISTQSGNSLIISTSEQVPDREYAVIIKNAADTEGNVKDALEGSFTGFRSAVTISDFFKISKVESLSKSSVKVYFTHPINANSELPSYYVIQQGKEVFADGSYRTIALKTQSFDGNSVILNLKENSFVEGTEYTLKVSGELFSLYGAKLNDGAGDSIRFKGNGSGSSYKEEPLEVSAVAVLDNKTLEVWFNKEIDTFYGKQFLNYSVIDTNGKVVSVNKAMLCEEEEKKGKVVRLGLVDSLLKSRNYILTINFLEDSMKQSAISNGRTEFIVEFENQGNLRITDTFAEDKNTVVVVFDRPLDSSTASNASYYNIYELTNSSSTVIAPNKVLYKTDAGMYIAKLFLPSDKPLSGSSTYKLRVSKDMKFNSGSISTSTADNQFSGSNSINQKPTIEKAVSISGDSLLVTFTKEISAEVPNLLVSNYNLEYRDNGMAVNRIPLSVTYINEKTLVLRFDTIDPNTEYTLKCISIKDLAGFNDTSSSVGLSSIKVTKGK